MELLNQWYNLLLVRCPAEKFKFIIPPFVTAMLDSLLKLEYKCFLSNPPKT